MDKVIAQPKLAIAMNAVGRSTLIARRNTILRPLTEDCLPDLEK